jgi:hypothetical protein
MKLESSVKESARRVTPSVLHIGISLLVCLVGREEGATSRAVLGLGLVFV